jgi:hypothetical protein
MKLTFLKSQYGLIPETPESIEWFEKLKLGQGVSGEFKKVRNYHFHKKMFALLNLGFEYWEPGEIDTKWGKPEKNFDVFRKNVTILAGYGEPVFNIDGTFKMEAKSISFASMDEEEFQELYQKVLTVLMNKILTNMSEDEIEDLTEKFLSFA